MKKTWSSLSLAVLCGALLCCETPSGAGRGGADDSTPVRTVELHHINADELAFELTQHFESQAQLISDPVTNALMVIAPTEIADEIERIAIEVDVYDGPDVSILRCSSRDAARAPVRVPQALQTSAEASVTLDYPDITLDELAEAMAVTLGLTVIHDERLLGVVTELRRKGPLTPQEAFAAFAEAFEEQGFTIVEGDRGELKIQPTDCLQLAKLSPEGASAAELRLARALEDRGPLAVLCLGDPEHKRPDPQALGLTDGADAPTFRFDFPLPPELVDPDDPDAARRLYAADISRVVDAVGEALQKDFVYDNRLRGVMAIIEERPVSAARAYELLSSALEFAGFAIVSGKGNTLEILPDRCIRVGGEQA